MDWFRHQSRGHSVLCSILAVSIFLLAACAYRPLTPVGLQCPTAPVQKITDTVVEHTMDGDMTVVVERAPQPGDKDFKQCNCAEKRNASAQTQVNDAFLNLPVAVLPPRLVLGRLPVAQPSLKINAFLSLNLVSLVQAPPVPPPDSISSPMPESFA